MLSLRRTAAIGSAAICLWALLVGPMPGCTPGADDFFDTPPVKITDADKVADTTISPVLDTPIELNDTVIWCGTIQLAWDELAKMYGGAVRFAEPVPPATAILNQGEVEPSDFDPASYIAIAGSDEDGVYDRINRAMQEKFHGIQHSELLPPTPKPNQNQSVYSNPAVYPEIVAYAFLFKKLEFPTPFERLKQPINFQGRPVAGFGIEGDPDKPDEAALADQVQILNYTGSDNFIIELSTKSLADRLILAKVSPSATLGQTIQQVEARIASSTPRSASPEAVLRVPKLAFDITHDFDELIGHRLLPVASTPGGRIEVARQIVKFQMNEKGVTLRSEFLAEALAASPEPLIFDKPFLILMQRKTSKRPYFAAWIGNARLLEER